MEALLYYVIPAQSLITRWRRNSLTGFLVPLPYESPAISTIESRDSNSTVLNDEYGGWGNDWPPS